jgi:hypothetical protein
MKVVKFNPHRDEGTAAQASQPTTPYFLTTKETRRHGVVVGQALLTGILSLTDFHTMLANCRVCPNGPATSVPKTETATLPQTPDWCANRAILEGLRGLV